MFHARGPAAANDRSPSNDLVRGTATVLDAADDVIRSIAVQAAMYHHAQLVFNALFDWQPMTWPKWLI